ncbi:MAG: hypothetical protein SFV54_13500 [Bryobacteraceae bacterium]|nr:hypothetical protein [Bryobacteraceae bacterium]
MPNQPVRRTPAQREASRRNGAKSKGPITPEGKARCAANGCLRSSPVRDLQLIPSLLERDLASEILATTHAFARSLQPANPLEIRLVEQIARASALVDAYYALLSAALAKKSPTSKPENLVATAGASAFPFLYQQIRDHNRALNQTERRFFQMQRRTRPNPTSPPPATPSRPIKKIDEADLGHTFPLQNQQIPQVQPPAPNPAPRPAPLTTAGNTLHDNNSSITYFPPRAAGLGYTPNALPKASSLTRKVCDLTRSSSRTESASAPVAAALHRQPHRPGSLFAWV